MSDSTIEIADVRLSYRCDGPADAPVLVMLNSLGCSLSMWERQMPALAQQFRVLRFDTRGHGQSSIGTAPYTIGRVGRDVVDLLDTLAIERAHFCGLSMGGMVGMWLGINAPERVHRLALCNTAAKIGTPERWNARIEAIRAGGMAAVAEGIIKIWFTEDFLAREPAAVAPVRAQLAHANAQGYVAACAAIRDMDLREAIAAIRAPTLLIAGTHDAATPPAEGRFIAERIAGARYVELPAAHLSNIEAAAQLNAALVEFFGS